MSPPTQTPSRLVLKDSSLAIIPPFSVCNPGVVD
jgi:hypothetical protein